MPMKKKPLSLKAVLFDFDGTLTRPGALNFEAIRKALGCPHGLPILEFIESLPDAAEQARLLAQLDRFETEAAAGSCPMTAQRSSSGGSGHRACISASSPATAAGLWNVPLRTFLV